MRKFHETDDAFIAIGGPVHGQLLQHYKGSSVSYVYFAPPPAPMWEPVDVGTLFEPVRHEAYRLWTVRCGPRAMTYFVHEGLNFEEVLELIDEFEGEGEDPEVRR